MWYYKYCTVGVEYCARNILNAYNSLTDPLTTPNAVYGIAVNHLKTVDKPVYGARINDY